MKPLDAQVKSFLRDCATNYDCDEGAHGLHSPHCRACEAEQLLKQMKTRTIAVTITNENAEVLDRCVMTVPFDVQYVHVSPEFPASPGDMTTFETMNIGKLVDDKPVTGPTDKLPSAL
jgi:hypothetical protein